MRIGIRSQLTGISVVLILLTAAALTISSTIILSRTLSSQLEARTAQVAAVVEGELALRRRDLEHTNDLWIHLEALQSQVKFNDWKTVSKAIDDLRHDRGVDLALVFDPNGEIVATSGITSAEAKPFAGAHTRSKLQRDRPQSLVEPIGGKLYLVSSELINDFGRPVGELMLAQAFTDPIAIDIQKKTGAQIVPFAADGPKASSLPLPPTFTAKLAGAWQALSTQRLVTVGHLVVGDISYFMMAVALPSMPGVEAAAGDKPLAACAFGMPETELAVTQRRTLIGAIALLFVITLLGAALALALGNTIARPIQAMAEQFSRISSSGDLSLRVQEAQTNEIGDMARSFNAMQERVEQLHGRVVQAEERMRKELQMASTVQEMLFQQEMPHNRACEVAAYTSTLVETSGDWYHVFDDTEAKRTIFVIADATGHGASAALLTAITHGFFQTMWTAKQGGDAALARIPPSTILSMLNSVVLNSAHGTITATVFVGVLHHGTRKMVYASAGHIPPIVTRWTNNEMKANILTCNPSSSIGSAEKPIYEDYTVELPPDSLVLIYTDGLTEVENPAGLQWGVRKLISVLRGCQTDTVESVRQKVLDGVTAFARGKELQDDLTYLTVRVL